ncbi:B-cell receptor CD22-like [Siniperca chuatsi]|uniref:B-cell receptor CD22-like n=1 Tax=Siniperca chuatsi TaxID=119488 RepID=UPI001CE151E5|nr:B-cell receptor CD22-like [Siniperca chuatsi]
MSLTAAASGFVVFLLSVPVIQSQNGWGVTYTSTQICALKGSTVEIRCSYRYPSRINSLDTTVEKTFWFTKMNGKEHVDLRTVSEYAGRVQYHCNEKSCTLRITDLRESDSAEYKFRFITNQPGGSFSGSPGVTLSVTAVQMQVTRITVHQSYTEADLKCHCSCSPAGRLSYVWFKNGVKGPGGTSYMGQFYPGDNISCALEGHEKFRSPSLYAPSVPSVSFSPSGEIVEGRSVTLTCSSEANIVANYTWYKKNLNSTHELLSKEPQLVFRSMKSSDSGEYYCAAENKLGGRTSKCIVINVKYAPKFPSASVSPSGQIVEGSSVTLTCSSDANPAANYTWYKENQTLPYGPGSIYNFTSISAEDRGIYTCMCENQYGQINSTSLFLDVHYAPKLPSVSVSPSGQIVEGSSVTLTCSSDANPAANYTWYKENQSLPYGPGSIYNFTSISAEDRGIYTCMCENQYGQINSTSLFLDVHYAPKLPSVSASPSGQIVEGSSVTLTCSSDANPAANYTWYKENEDSPKASGQIFNITDFRPEHSGNYYCEAQNSRGRRSSTLYLAVMAGEWKLITSGTVTVILIVIIGLLISALQWIRKKQPSEPIKRPDNIAQKQPAEQGAGLHYASIHFSKKEADPLYSNIRPAQPQRHKREEEADRVVYATVTLNSSSTAPT